MKNVRFFFAFFFQITSKVQRFINSVVCIGESTSKLLDYIEFLFKKVLNIIKTVIISSKKMRNSGIYIYMIMPTRSSERIFYLMRYTGNMY